MAEIAKFCSKIIMSKISSKGWKLLLHTLNTIIF